MHQLSMTNRHSQRSFIDRLRVRDISGLGLYFRLGTVDEKVLSIDYQTPRFFAPGYHAKETDTILDVGAHIGVFTALAAQKAPRGRVHAIEGASENFEILIDNVAANGLSNVRAHRTVLGDTIGQVKLHHGVDNWDHSLVGQLAGIATGSWELVQSQTLEYFLTANAITQVDYMKMNVEGAEYDILLKAPRAVVQSIVFMLIECHPADDHRGEELVDWLRMCGFVAEVVWSRSVIGKGWITARYGMVV